MNSQIMAGDWICAFCAFHVYARHQKCPKCGNPKFHQTLQLRPSPQSQRSWGGAGGVGLGNASMLGGKMSGRAGIQKQKHRKPRVKGQMAEDEMLARAGITSGDDLERRDEAKRIMTLRVKQAEESLKSAEAAVVSAKKDLQSRKNFLHGKMDSEMVEDIIDSRSAAEKAGSSVMSKEREEVE